MCFSQRCSAVGFPDHATAPRQRLAAGRFPVLMPIIRERRIERVAGHPQRWEAPCLDADNPGGNLPVRHRSRLWATRQETSRFGIAPGLCGSVPGEASPDTLPCGCAIRRLCRAFSGGFIMGFPQNKKTDKTAHQAARQDKTDATLQQSFRASCQLSTAN
jgi:hypothetical protein